MDSKEPKNTTASYISKEQMMDIFKPFKDKLKKNIVEFLKEKFEDFKREATAAARSLDLNNDGIKDIEEVVQDCEKIAQGVALIAAGASSLAQLGMLYYTKFGSRFTAPRPTEKLAALEQAQDIA